MTNGMPDDEAANLDAAFLVARLHRTKLNDVTRSTDIQASGLTHAIEGTEALLGRLGHAVPGISAGPKIPQSNPTVTVIARPWDEMVAEARQLIPTSSNLSDLLSQQEIDAILRRHASIGSELDWTCSLDRYDWTLSIAAGVIAGLIDIFLVVVPAHPGYLGSPGSKGGWLSNVLKEKSTTILSPERIRLLENEYRVPYDPSVNSKLSIPISGLGPNTHRFQSLGHDPLLGFIFGIRDILAGEFSGIGKDGVLTIQSVGDPFLAGEHLFIRLFEALRIQFGHLASDVATSRGLPAPLMPLLLFLQTGAIGVKGYTIGEVARQMYRSGYDFRHFLAGSVPVMISELIVRIGFFVRALSQGKTLAEAIPTTSSLQLRRQLLITHSVATLINAGKVYVTGNPLAVNWAQILAFLRHAMPELAFLLYGKDAVIAELVQKSIMDEYISMNSAADARSKASGMVVIL